MYVCGVVCIHVCACMHVCGVVCVCNTMYYVYVCVSMHVCVWGGVGGGGGYVEELVKSYFESLH